MVMEVLSKAHESLSSLQRVLSGSEMLTAKSEKDATELLKGEVPPSWKAAWEGPSNPS